MTYDPTVPAAAQRISDTQSPIQTNFDQANTIFNEDHFNYNDASGAPPPPGLRGFHRKAVFSELAVAPTAFADIGTVYTIDNGDGRTDLFYRYDTGALGNSKILPLSAVKVMAAWNVGLADGVIPGASIFQAYNIASIDKSTPGGNNYSFDIRFTDSLDSNAPNTNLEYIVLLTMGSSVILGNLASYVTPTRNDRIVIIAPNVPAQFLRLSMIIMTL